MEKFRSFISFIWPVSIACLAFSTIGCSDIREMKRRDRVLQQMVSNDAPESEVYRHIPADWTKYEKGSEQGRIFGDSLARRTSPDLQKAKESWLLCDRALWHTTESVVTIVFIKTNTVIDYYIGVQ
jgi:hypothetical protein